MCKHSYDLGNKLCQTHNFVTYFCSMLLILKRNAKGSFPAIKTCVFAYSYTTNPCYRVYSEI